MLRLCWDDESAEHSRNFQQFWQPIQNGFLRVSLLVSKCNELKGSWVSKSVSWWCHGGPQSGTGANMNIAEVSELYVEEADRCNPPTSTLCFILYYFLFASVWGVWPWGLVHIIYCKLKHAFWLPVCCIMQNNRAKKKNNVNLTKWAANLTPKTKMCASFLEESQPLLHPGIRLPMLYYDRNSIKVVHMTLWQGNSGQMSSWFAKQSLKSDRCKTFASTYTFIDH